MNFHFFFMGSAGDFFPLFRTSIALLSRGHSVTFVASDEYVWIRPFIEKTPISLVCINADTRFEQGEKPTFDVGGHRSLSDLVEPLVSAHFRYVQDTYVPGNTVFINYIGYVGVKFACEHLGAPYVGVLYAPNPLAETGIFDDDSLAKLSGALQRVASDNHISRVPTVDLTWILSSPYNLAYFPQWMGNLGESVFHAGFPYPVKNDATLPGEVVAFLAERKGEKIVLFTPGTSMPDPAFYAGIVIEACVQLGIHCIVVSHQIGQLALQPEWHGRVLLLGQIEFEAIFDKVDLVIHHAGVGTLSEALRFGVPQLVKPEFWDQFYNASFIETRNVGRAVKKEAFTRETLTYLIDDILKSDDIHQACKKMQVECLNQNGAVISADFLESILVHDKVASQHDPVVETL